MQTKFINAMVTGLSLMIMGTATFAHHGRAAYDEGNVITLEATITEFRFINPHAQIYFDVIGEDEEPQHWKAEITAPNRLSRGGWSKTTLTPGDKVTISGDHARNGSNAIRVSEIVLSDGTSPPAWSAGILPP